MITNINIEQFWRFLSSKTFTVAHCRNTPTNSIHLAWPYPDQNHLGYSGYPADRCATSRTHHSTVQNKCTKNLPFTPQAKTFYKSSALTESPTQDQNPKSIILLRVCSIKDFIMFIMFIERVYLWILCDYLLTNDVICSTSELKRLNDTDLAMSPDEVFDIICKIGRG